METIFPFLAGELLLFTGDSITDCKRSRPIGQRAWGGLGDGYVSMIDSRLAAISPEIPLNILNTGTSGNRVIDLEARWETDVKTLKPDWLTILIGINDVWRQFDSPFAERQVLPDEYEETYRRLLDSARPGLKGLVLMSPYFIESYREDPLRQRMQEYGQIVRTLATDFDAVFVDLQAAFDRYLNHQSSHTLCADRVHPNAVGHMLIAHAFEQAFQQSPRNA